MTTKCAHEKVKCLSCGEEGSPAKLMGSREKTMTPAAIAQRKKAASMPRQRKDNECFKRVLSDAQIKTLTKISASRSKGCEFADIQAAGGNERTLRCLEHYGYIAMVKVYGSKFWYITPAGIDWIK